MNIHKSPYSEEEEEEEEGERGAPNKAGPMRPPLLNGIKLKGTKHEIYRHIFGPMSHMSEIRPNTPRTCKNKKACILPVRFILGP